MAEKADLKLEEKLGKAIWRLVQYGVEKDLIPERERCYSINLLLDIFNQNDYSEPENVTEEQMSLQEILDALSDIACEMGLIEDSITYRDLFDTKLMNCILPRPAQVTDTFWEKYKKSPEEATDYYYGFSQDSNYIRRERIAKDLKWKVSSAYGEVDITVNLSKPEKDPKAIAAAAKTASSSYPKCLLCVENEGYAGTVTHPARQNHRIIPLTLNGDNWALQYSPYVYYNEHCIVLNGSHVPMKISRATFRRLLDFVELFPRYFLGSNADLPIVGGSILSHDHFQGGHYTFAMAKAETKMEFQIKGFEDVECSILHWPMSVIRIRSAQSERLVELADYILGKWRNFTDEEAFIYAETDGVPHNTITPIARFREERYELDLVLRNNITTEEHPMGVYHPHEKLHHIKKENIGLIEVMGLAVLPARLKTEMEMLAEYILAGKDVRADEMLMKHADWVDEFLPQYDDVNEENVMHILEQEIGKVFIAVLEDAGVYKCTPEGLEAFKRFLNTL